MSLEGLSLGTSCHVMGPEDDTMRKDREMVTLSKPVDLTKRADPWHRTVINRPMGQAFKAYTTKEGR